VIELRSQAMKNDVPVEVVIVMGVSGSGKTSI
jgi:ABC-type lipoprotein export system ATPase subunit